MAGTKVLRGNISVFAFSPEAVADWANPTAAELNDALTNGLGWDISCAIADDSLTLNQTDPDTDDSISICDIGTVETPTFDNYEVSFDSFRNGPATVNAPVAVYDLPVDLFQAPDLPYFIVKRVAVKQGTELAAGQSISAFGVDTDYPTDVLGDNELIMFGSRFKPNGKLLMNKDLA